MGYVNLKIKLMPSSPDTNLEEIKEVAKKLVEDNEGKNVRFEEEPIAFGLKAVILYFTWPEEKELDTIENSLEKIDNVVSKQVLDMRRAIG
jgi:translation elongation factor aEF-1 beta